MASTLTEPAPRRTMTRDHPTIAVPPGGAPAKQPLLVPASSSVEVAAREDAESAPETRPAHDTTARAYGERAAHLTEWLPLGWDTISSSLTAGWAIAHEASCGCAEDWRLSLPLVKEGWTAARVS